MSSGFSQVSTRKKLAYIALILVFSCQNPICNEVPTLFYRSDLECLSVDSWVPCKEIEMCDEQSGFTQHRWVDDPLKSISMQFDLVCEKRLLEATLIFLGPIAQMMAFLLSVFIDVPREKKFAVLMKILLVQALMMLSIQIFNGSLFIVTLVWVAWNFVWAYFFSLILLYVEDNYPKQVYLDTPVYMNIMWPLGGIVFVFATFFNSYWVYHCTYLIAMPMLISACVFFLLTPKQNELTNSDQQPLLVVTGGLQVEEKTKQNFIEEMKEKFSELKQETVCLKNLWIYLSLWVVSTLGYNGTFIAFNTLQGNLQTNVIVSIIAELCGSLSIMYLLTKYDCVKIQYYNFLIIGAIQASTMLFDESFPLGQSLVINLTKTSNKIMFAANLLALQYWMKPKFIPFTFSVTNIASIIFNSILPFYKYYMDEMQVNFFCGIGILSIVCGLMVKSSVKVRDPNQEHKNSGVESRKNTIVSSTPIIPTILPLDPRLSEIV